MTHDPQPTFERAESPSAGPEQTRTAAGEQTPTRGRFGQITHTELVSADPPATREWCASVLGWTFMPAMQLPESEYHIFTYTEGAGGGIRVTQPSEAPGSIPYVEVADAAKAFAAAIEAGAEEMMSPTQVMEGVTIALVRAPGGVMIGFAGP